jgi:hypothetical protein
MTTKLPKYKYACRYYDVLTIAKCEMWFKNGFCGCDLKKCVVVTYKKQEAHP